MQKDEELRQFYANEKIRLAHVSFNHKIQGKNFHRRPQGVARGLQYPVFNRYGERKSWSSS